MTNHTIRIADSKGRILLPGFANATVLIEAISPNEYRVRRAQVIPEDELRFSEEDNPVQLSEADAGFGCQGFGCQGVRVSGVRVSGAVSCPRNGS